MAEIAEVGDDLEADFVTGRLVNLTRDKVFQCSPTPAFIIGVLQAGGIFPYYRKHVQAEQNP